MLSVKTVSVDSELVDRLNSSTSAPLDESLSEAEELIDELHQLHECGMPLTQLADLIAEELNMDRDTVLEYIA